MVLAVYFAMVITVPLTIGTWLLLRGLPRSRRCPLCARDTVQLRSTPHALATRLLRTEQLQLRWCMDCGWKGAVRLPRLRRRATPRPAPAVLRPPTEAAEDPEGVGIRRLHVDGCSVDVLVQCWAEAGEWRGRLLFVGPGGRTFSEGTCSLRGPTPLQILSRALALPDQALAGRFRQIAS